MAFKGDIFNPKADNVTLHDHTVVELIQDILKFEYILN